MINQMPTQPTYPASPQASIPTQTTSAAFNPSSTPNAIINQHRTDRSGFIGGLSPFQKFWVFMVSAIMALFAIFYLPKIIFPASTLTVVGSGKVQFQPDTVSMIVTKVNAGSDSIQAINDGDANLKALIDTVTSVAGQDAEIQKTFYQVQPSTSSLTTTYQVINAFSLKFSAVDKTSEMIKTLYNAGATTVSNVSFSTQNKIQISQDAREMAVKDARDQAKKIAQAAGKRLGKIVAITDDQRTAEGTVSDVINQDTGLNNVTMTKNVSVIFEMW